MFDPRVNCFHFCISLHAVRSRSLLSVESPQNFQQAACDWFRHIFFRDEGDIRQQSDSKETDLNSNYRSYRTDIYSALTPPLNALQMDNETQRNNYVSVKAWNLFVWFVIINHTYTVSWMYRSGVHRPNVKPTLLTSSAWIHHHCMHGYDVILQLLIF